MTALYTVGLLIGTTWRAFRGEFTLEWFLIAIAGMAAIYVIEKLLDPYLRKQAIEQQKTDYVFKEQRPVLASVDTILQEMYRQCDVPTLHRPPVRYVYETMDRLLRDGSTEVWQGILTKANLVRLSVPVQLSLLTITLPERDVPARMRFRARVEEHLKVVRPENYERLLSGL